MFLLRGRGVARAYDAFSSLVEIGDFMRIAHQARPHAQDEGIAKLDRER